MLFLLCFPSRRCAIDASNQSIAEDTATDYAITHYVLEADARALRDSDFTVRTPHYRSFITSGLHTYKQGW